MSGCDEWMLDAVGATHEHSAPHVRTQTHACACRAGRYDFLQRFAEEGGPDASAALLPSVAYSLALGRWYQEQGGCQGVEGRVRMCGCMHAGGGSAFVGVCWGRGGCRVRGGTGS